MGLPLPGQAGLVKFIAKTGSCQLLCGVFETFHGIPAGKGEGIPILWLGGCRIESAGERPGKGGWARSGRWA